MCVLWSNNVVVVRVQVGKEFPDTRQNVRKIEFIKEKVAARTAGLKGSLQEQLADFLVTREVDPLCGLVANFYSLKTKKITAVRMALGDWSGCYNVTTW